MSRGGCYRMPGGKLCLEMETSDKNGGETVCAGGSFASNRGVWKAGRWCCRYGGAG